MERICSWHRKRSHYIGGGIAGGKECLSEILGGKAFSTGGVLAKKGRRKAHFSLLRKGKNKGI